MLRSKILSMLSVLIIAVTMLIPTGASVFAAAPEKVAATSGCSASLWAPYKAGNQIRARVTVTCSTTKPSMQAGVGLSQTQGYWDGPWSNVFCSNTKTCTATISIACKTGYWYSAGDGNATGMSGVLPSPPESGRTYIKC
jgi:hypothetical protein